MRGKYLRRRGAMIAGAMALAATAMPCLAQDAMRPADVGRMEQVVRSYVDSKRFMGSVLVARSIVTAASFA